MTPSSIENQSPSTADAFSGGIGVPPRPGVRRFGRVNWIGFQTLLWKEIKRFLKVSMQTIVAPAVTSVLFLIIFTFAVGQYRGDVGALAYTDFLVPGLIMMTLLQNAFANTSSSLMIAKIQGNIVDYLMPPLSAGELTAAIVAGGIVRGVLVALFTALAMAPLAFVSLQIHSLAAVVYFAIAASCLLSLVGMLTGVWAEKFDHLATITNFVIIPLTFLSGTFYSMQHDQSQMPDFVATVSNFNPFVYLIDGYRFGMTGIWLWSCCME
ncbi:MAG: ABC transporter permease [Pseudomonadota bacterium]